MPSTEYSNDLFDGMAWGDTVMVAGNYGRIFHSDDFFKSYIVDSIYKSNVFQAVSFVNRNIGYITSCTVQGGMLKTIDGGNTWTPLPFGPASGVCISENLVFVAPDTAYTARRDFSTTFWFTYNEGQDWNYNLIPYEGVYKIETVQDSFVYVLIVNKLAGPQGILQLYRTKDYGANWQSIFSSNSSVTRSSDFHFINDTTVIMVVDGAILKSIDAGFSFDTVMYGDRWLNLVSNNGRAISFFNQDTGFVAFSYDVYKTFDGGDTWLKTSFAFDSMEMANGNNINFVKAISGQKVVLGCFRGNIYITESGGGVWSDINEIKEREQLAIYPNPATHTLTLSIPNFTEALKVTVTNPNGQLIQQQDMLTANYTLNVANLPKGMYFVIVAGEQGRWVKRFVKQ